MLEELHLWYVPETWSFLSSVAIMKYLLWLIVWSFFKYRLGCYLLLFHLLRRLQLWLQLALLVLSIMQLLLLKVWFWDSGFVKEMFSKPKFDCSVAHFIFLQILPMLLLQFCSLVLVVKIWKSSLQVQSLPLTKFPL